MNQYKLLLFALLCFAAPGLAMEQEGHLPTVNKKQDALIAAAAKAYAAFEKIKNDESDDRGSYLRYLARRTFLQSYRGSLPSWEKFLETYDQCWENASCSEEMSKYTAAIATKLKEQYGRNATSEEEINARFQALREELRAELHGPAPEPGDEIQEMNKRLRAVKDKRRLDKAEEKRAVNRRPAEDTNKSDTNPIDSCQLVGAVFIMNLSIFYFIFSLSMF